MDAEQLIIPTAPKRMVGTGQTTLFYIPRWVVSIVEMILEGHNPGGAQSGITFDEQHDMVLYRKFGTADRELFPETERIDEIWITLEIPQA